jgi:plastocyanin
MHKQPKLAPLGGASHRLRAPRITRLAIMSVGLAMLAGTQLAAAAESTVEVTIDNFTFAPATITIEPGTTVKWLNRDDIPHTVVAKSLAFRSKALDTDDSFSHQFDDVGVVDYFCSLHPHMSGKVVVRAHGG